MSVNNKPQNTEINRINKQLSKIKETNKTLVKEFEIIRNILSCQNTISEIFSNINHTTEEILGSLTQAIPQGLSSNPEVGIRIEICDKTYESVHFNKSHIVITQKVKNQEKTYGVIQASSSLKLSKEENDFIENISKRICSYCNKEEYSKNLKSKEKAFQELLKNLRVSEEKYKTLFYNSPVGYSIIKDNKFIECNIEVLRMLGYSKEEIIGKSPFDISPRYQPNGQSSKTFAKQLINQAIKTGKIKFNWIHTKKNKEDALFFVQLVPIKQKNETYIFTTWWDISEKQKYEEQLRILQRAVDQSPISIVIANVDGRIEYVNPEYCITTGYTKAEIINQGVDIINSGFSSKADFDKIWETLMSGKEWKGILKNQRKNGTSFWEATTIAPIKNNEGEITHFVALKEDITDIRQYQLALKKSEERFSQITELSRTVVWEFNTEGIYTYVSPASKIVWGYSPEELIGKLRFFELYPENYRKEFLEKSLDVGQNQTVFKDFENPIQQKNGTIIWVSSSGEPIYDENKNLAGYRGADIDINERKLAKERIAELNNTLEQKVNKRTQELETANKELLNEIEQKESAQNQLETFFNVALDLLCIADKHGNFLKLNKAWEILLGYSLNELKNTEFLNFVHPEDLEATKNINKLLFKDKNIVPFINRYKTKSGDYRYIEWRSVPVGDLVYAAARDVTERIEIEKKLKQTIAHEKELNELKSRFVSMASHEFRTPLASIILANENLRNYWERMNASQIQQKLDTIENQANHLNSIVSNVMQVSKIQEGKIGFDPQSYDIIKICKSVINDFNASLNIENHIQFKTNTTQEIFKFDKRLIMQVLHNLIFNAIKYSEKYPKVSVNIISQKNQIIIEISDKGIGIPEEDMKNLFQPFFRGKNVKNIEGNGLGLSIVKESLQLHNAKISCNSILNEGSTFIITFINSKE
jgi:PAS domain S-box-containing protein